MSRRTSSSRLKLACVPSLVHTSLRPKVASYFQFPITLTDRPVITFCGFVNPQSGTFELARIIAYHVGVHLTTLIWHLHWIESHPPRHKLLRLTPRGLEPAISFSEGRRLSHSTKEASAMPSVCGCRPRFWRDLRSPSPSVGALFVCLRRRFALFSASLCFGFWPPAALLATTQVFADISCQPNARTAPATSTSRSFNMSAKRHSARDRWTRMPCVPRCGWHTRAGLGDASAGISAVAGGGGSAAKGNG